MPSRKNEKAYCLFSGKNQVFIETICSLMDANNIELVGAVHDFTCPTSGKNYMFFPIRRI